MIDRMIVDADLCIKLGGSSKYRFLYDLLPQISGEIYIHTHAYGEVMMPSSAVSQLRELKDEKKISVVNENNLDSRVRALYSAAYNILAGVMLDPERPNKNRGEVCSLAYAKAAGIPVFATDERELQPMIDKLLNTGMDDIRCIRIVDIVNMAKSGDIALSRKEAKALWVIAGKKKEEFDEEVWPAGQENEKMI